MTLFTISIDYLSFVTCLPNLTFNFYIHSSKRNFIMIIVFLLVIGILDLEPLKEKISKKKVNGIHTHS